MCHPYSQLAATEGGEHHAVVLWYVKGHELALELTGVVVQHACPGRSACVAAYQSEFHHELTSVADAEAQRVLAGIELVEGFLGLGVVKEGSRPSLG